MIFFFNLKGKNLSLDNIRSVFKCPGPHPHRVPACSQGQGPAHDTRETVGTLGAPVGDEAPRKPEGACPRVCKGPGQGEPAAGPRGGAMFCMHTCRPGITGEDPGGQRGSHSTNVSVVVAAWKVGVLRTQDKMGRRLHRARRSHQQMQALHLGESHDRGGREGPAQPPVPRAPEPHVLGCPNAQKRCANILSVGTAG